MSIENADSAALSELTVLDLAGHPHPLAGFWADRQVVLALVRHYG